MRLVHDIAGGRSVTKAMLRVGYPKTTTYHGFIVRTRIFRQAVSEYVDALLENIPNADTLEKQVHLLHSENEWTRQHTRALREIFQSYRELGENDGKGEADRAAAGGRAVAC